MDARCEDGFIKLSQSFCMIHGDTLVSPIPRIFRRVP